MSNDLYKSINYITPLKYVSGRIVEYDIKSANITMLKKYHMISEEYYYYLQSLPKMNREIEIGNLINTNRKIYETVSIGIIEAKRLFFEANNIDPNYVIRIANDAVYINTSIDLPYTVFDDIIFKVKSISNVMIRVGKLTIFFWYNENGMNIDVIGLRRTQEIHAPYMLSFIAQVINYLERATVKDALNFVSTFFEDYVNYRLDKEYYRELTPESLYKLKGSMFYLMDIENIYDIDINYNLYIIREVYAIVLEKFNMELRRK